METSQTTSEVKKHVKKVNIGVRSPLAIGDSLHGTFDKETGELLEFSLTNSTCTTDYTKKLNTEQINICKTELRKIYEQYKRTNA